MNRTRVRRVYILVEYNKDVCRVLNVFSSKNLAREVKTGKELKNEVFNGWEGIVSINKDVTYHVLTKKIRGPI